MTKLKITLISITSFVGILLLIFILSLFDLGMFKFLAPKKENVRREVFESTKSYSHGKIQDLAKYYKEYSEGGTEEKQIITTVIQSQFAEFDAEKISSAELKRFLINIRGY